LDYLLEKIKNIYYNINVKIKKENLKMRNKELKNLAQKIAKCEMIIQEGGDESETLRAQEEIMKLSSHIKNFEDIVIIDEMVQDILKKLKK
jgi:hypothetical protein